MTTRSSAAAATRARVLPEERLIFSHVVQGVFENALKGRVTPALKEKVLAEGINLDKKLLPAYPFDAYIRSLHHVISEIFPDQPREEAFRQFAAMIVAGYNETLMGKASFGVLRLLGPRRAISRLLQTFRSSDNFTEVRFRELAPNAFDVWTNARLDAPGLFEGLLTSLLELSGARNVNVRSVPGQDSVHVTWDG